MKRYTQPCVPDLGLVPTSVASLIVRNAASHPSARRLQAVQMQLASQYIGAFGNVAKQSTTMLLPKDVGDPASMVATAMGVMSTLGPAAAAARNGQ